MAGMTTVHANDVRIPSAAREALARREVVMVLSHGRPAYVIVSPDEYEASHRPAAGRVVGRRLREALEMLAAAPLPDSQFGDDLEAIRASVGPMPANPWERS
jgi:PHD/YefM family antitoxin component YafN of YafNO toxin-antitoxin module